MELPEIPELIQTGIRDRPDIVHRNGKSRDGQERSWDQDQIKALKEAVQLFATEVEDLLRKLPADPDAPEQEELNDSQAPTLNSDFKRSLQA